MAKFPSGELFQEGRTGAPSSIMVCSMFSSVGRDTVLLRIFRLLLLIFLFSLSFFFLLISYFLLFFLFFSCFLPSLFLLFIFTSFLLLLLHSSDYNYSTFLSS